MPSFKINTIQNRNGPGIFGLRLKEQLEKYGWGYANVRPDYNIVFASGDYISGSVNTLRLDGLYFDSKNTIGNTDKLNKPIKIACNTFDKIIFQSKFAKLQYLSHFGPIKVPYKIIYNGVPDIFSSNGEKIVYPFKKTFIVSSDWRVHKRLDAVIQAFKCFDLNNNYGLVILGNCKNKVKHKNIIYKGKVHHTELPRYIRGADAGILLSWLDCSPNVIYEFLACGLPVLCSHNGGTKEIVKKDGITLKLEQDYEFNRVDLYHPPKPNVSIVYKGMQDILDWSSKVYRPDLNIKYTVKQYIKFMVEEK